MQNSYNFGTITDYNYDDSKIISALNNLKLLLEQGNVDFTEDFADDTDFVYDNTKAEFSGGQVQQKLYDITGQSFIEDFADDTDFTYDNDLAEFSGGQVQQINKRPANAILLSDFTDNNEDADWSDIGTGIGTLSDGATVHDGKLDLAGYVANRRLSINAYNTSHNSQQGCMRCLFTPNYTGAPTQIQYIMQWRNGGLENNIQVLQNTSRFIQAWIRDGDGNNILATASFGVYDFTAGQTYEIEFNWNCDTGEHRMFINGVQQGTTASGTGTRDGRVDQFDFGVYYNNLGQPNFFIEKFIYFNAVQHTTDYTPDWSDIYSYDYVTSKVELPTMTYSGTQIKEFTEITSVEVGTPKYILDDKYWNGSSWISSNGSYSQANTLIEVNTNIATLSASGSTLNIDIIFDNSFSQSSVDNIQVNYIGNKYMETSVILPEMEHAGDGTIKLFNSLATTYTGSPKILLEIGRSGDKLYWDGDSWEISDETYDQATDPVTFNANCNSLDVDGEDYGQFTIIFPDSNTQSSVSELTANMNIDIGYFTTNPTIKNDETIRTDSITSIAITSTITGNDLVKLTIEVDGIEKYWNGTSWGSSSGYSQSNTLIEINDNISTLLNRPADIRWVLYLHSDDGTTTPIVEDLTINYSFAGLDKDEVEKCTVYWYMAEGRKINIYLKNDAVKYKTNVLLHREDYNFEITATATEYCEVELPDTENMENDQFGNEQTYVVIMDGKIYETIIPNQDGILLFDLNLIEV